MRPSIAFQLLILCSAWAEPRTGGAGALCGVLLTCTRPCTTAGLVPQACLPFGRLVTLVGARCAQTALVLLLSFGMRTVRWHSSGVSWCQRLCEQPDERREADAQVSEPASAGRAPRECRRDARAPVNSGLAEGAQGGRY